MAAKKKDTPTQKQEKPLTNAVQEARKRKQEIFKK